MDHTPTTQRAVPRIESLKVENYRALRKLELRELRPLTVLLGPNGSGKSTVFDVFAFLSECFAEGLRRAWDRRGRFRELRTRDVDGPIVIELKYREIPSGAGKTPVITYHLEIDENEGGPIVAKEWLRWSRQPGRGGRPFTFLEFARGSGQVAGGEVPDADAQREPETLDSPDMIAASTLGQFARHPRVSALRRFITGWYLSYLTAGGMAGSPEAGPQERLSGSGDNLPNVMQYLSERYPQRLQEILASLTARVPRLEKVEAHVLEDGRLLLQVKDAPFSRPILAKFASDGTLKMLAYLTVLRDPDPPQFVGIEEPENHLHPRLLPGLAEECRKAASHTQMLVTTHSPFFIERLVPSEVWVLYRDERGYTQARPTKDMPGIGALVEAGATLGDLWLEGFFDVGDPLTNAGGPNIRLPGFENGGGR